MKTFKILFLLVATCYSLLLFSICYAQEKEEPVIINGDRVEFLTGEKKAIEKGNVTVTYQDMKLTCDKLTFYSQEKIGIAEGKVHLDYKNGVLEVEKINYNFVVCRKLP